MQWASHLLYKQPLALEETNNKLYSGVYFYECWLEVRYVTILLYPLTSKSADIFITGPYIYNK